MKKYPEHLIKNYNWVKQEKKYNLPTPKPTYCCGDRLKPCSCGADVWKSAGDQDCGDWEEEIFDCQHCGKRIYVELPD